MGTNKQDIISSNHTYNYTYDCYLPKRKGERFGHRNSKYTQVFKMKKGEGSSLGVLKIAEILFIILVLIIISSVIFGYSTTLKESIMKFFGFKTESETIHEGNIQAEEEFKNLLDHVEKCSKSKDATCGCTFNINNFNKNHLIISHVSYLELRIITNIKKSEVIKDVNSGTLREKADIKNTNCFFDKNLKKVDVPMARIFFDEEKPYLDTSITSTSIFKIAWETGKQTFGGKSSRKYINKDYPLYKNSKEEICWLSEKAQNIKECK